MKIFAVVVLLILLYIVLIMPRTGTASAMRPFTGVRFAHRGLYDKSAGVPENSAAAFRAAVERGYGIELDVQLSSDGVPVVIHDYDVARVAPSRRGETKVCKMTFDELKSLRLDETDEGVPAFSDVLAQIGGAVPLLIELKGENADVSVCEKVCPMLDDYIGDFCLESFNPLLLSWLRKNRPRFMRGQLSTDFFRDRTKGGAALHILHFLLANLLLDCISRPDFIAYKLDYPHMLSFSIVTRLFGAKAFAWTVRSEKDAEKCRPYFDSLIFEGFLCGEEKSENAE